jgi:hypothetical protein
MGAVYYSSLVIRRSTLVKIPLAFPFVGRGTFVAHDQRPTTNDVFLKNSVDTLFIVPQYLGVGMPLIPQVERLLADGSRSWYQGKIVHGGKLSWQRKRKQKRRNTNRLARRYLARARIFISLSGEAPLERLLLCRPAWIRGT